MHSDSAFYIGNSHKVCQDYVFHKDTDEKSMIWLADGCSSSPHTDFGSRLLVMSAHKAFENFNFTSEDQDEKLEYTLLNAEELQKGLGLPNQSLDATLLGIISDNEQFSVIAQGDGMVVKGYRDGSIVVYNLIYTKGYPYYLNYCPDKDGRFEQFFSMSGNQLKINCCSIDKNSNVTELEEIYDTPSLFTLNDKIDEYRFIAVLSDGVTSFVSTEETTSKVQKPIDYMKFIEEVVRMKNWNGEFVQRRMYKFLKDSEDRGWKHHDDFSMGMVYFHQ